MSVGRRPSSAPGSMRRAVWIGSCMAKELQRCVHYRVHVYQAGGVVSRLKNVCVCVLAMAKLS